MYVFLDTSAYAKRYVEEKGSNRMQKILSGADELGISVICIPELLSAMNRRLREKSLSKNQYSKIKTRLSEEIVDVQVIKITESVIENAIALLEKNNLRSMDAIHIASAMEWKADIFVTSDKRQTEAAETVIKKVQFV